MSVMQAWAPVVESAQARGEPAGVAALKRAREVDIDFLAEQLPEALAESVDGVTRVGNIVKAMKEFAYPDQDDASEADINQALKNTIVVSQNEHKMVATVETDFEEGLPHVLCFPGEVNQVFLNLLVNGAHAIAAAVVDGELGVLRITTRQDGDDIVVSISDTGTGIPDEIRDRIFEPFFTTKEVGKGTGQGLAIAHRIVVDKHGGSLRVDSEVGRGSTFHIRLPIAGRTARAA